MINAFCWAYGSSGLAVHARDFLTALRQFEDIAIVPWDHPGFDDRIDDDGPNPELREMLANGAKRDPEAASLGIGPIDFLRGMTGPRCVPYVVWEPSRLPAYKVRILQAFDVLWTPSTWGRQLLIDNGISPEKIFVVPGGVDCQLFRPLPRIVEPQRPFRFLSVGKWETRKNIGQLIEGFCREFGPEEPVELVLHCRHLPGTPTIEERVDRLAGWVHPPIRISNPLPAARMSELYNSCDVFVLPTRAEAWGLPILEAMACGLPVIVTDYSAHIDFVNERNGYPIKVAGMVDVYDPLFYPNTFDLGSWAQPDSHDLQRLLRHVFENRAEAREKGRIARADAEQRWTWDHAAAAAYRHLRPERSSQRPL